MNRMLVLGTEIDRISFQEAIELALNCMDHRRGDYVVTPNSEIVLRAGRERELRTAISGAVLSLPDSVGVDLVCRILGTPIQERIPGIDFASALLEQMAKREKSVYFLGAKEGVAARAAAALLKSFPGIVIAGTENGYFKPSDEEELIGRINTASPDLLLVCLGAPKQEKFMFAHRGELATVRLMAGLGGSLDGFAGNVKRAPKWMIRLQLEWLYRLVKEPKRLGRMMRLPKYILLAFRARRKG